MKIKMRRELRNTKKYIVKTLINFKIFIKFKYESYFQLVINRTDLFNYNYKLNNNCIIVKKSLL